jgi:broad specificity phosphatase PhoE
VRILEHLRHAERAPDSAHLSARGLAAARDLAPRIGAFDRVLTSPKPRAIETARALGFERAATREMLRGLPEEIEARVDAAHPGSFAEYEKLVAKSPAVGEFARGLAARWRAELERLPDPGRLLLISHGGLIEIGTVAAVPTFAHAFGPPLRPLEGVRLMLSGNRWTGGDVVRRGEPPAV